MTADTSELLTHRRIGLFGGTFDPVHHGHLAAAWQVKQRLGLDAVWLIVANEPWQKRDDRRITPAAIRLEWVRLAVDGVDGLEASDIEIELGGNSYTIDTIAALGQRFPGVEWCVVVGADAAEHLDTWHRADELREQANLVVVNRPGSDIGSISPGWRFEEVEIPAMDLSSTELRELAASGLSLRFLTTDAVAEAIERTHAFVPADGSPNR